MAGIINDIMQFFSTHPNLTQFFKDLAFSLVIVGIIALALYAYAGVWTPVVSISGVSMLPHLQTGDLALVQCIERSPVHTYEDSVGTDYWMFDDYGDVIVYYPRGDRTQPMIIHRAMYWVNKSEPMWPGGPDAPESGYITKGDNEQTNYLSDQQSGICYQQPVRKEWIHGAVKYRVPYLGYLRALIKF